MAKKTGGNPKTQVTQTELKVVRLQLPLEDQRKLRMLAASENTSMAILARRVMQDDIARHALKVGGK
jgi:hypothetical protein